MSQRVGRRVAITGVGLVSALGSDPAAYWQALASGTSGVTRAPVEGVEGEVVGAPVTGFSPRAHIDPKSLRLMAPAVAFGVAGAQLAMTDSTFALGVARPGSVRRVHGLARSQFRSSRLDDGRAPGQ